MKALFVLFLLMATALAGCATDIRIRNDSGVDFKNVIVGDKKYGDIKHGETTQYRAWELAFGYAFVSLLAGGKPYKIQPVDFVGETPLADGKFTYVLTLKGGNLDIRAEKDAK